ncbi:MAG: B12-binding domain-containing radical SAM protein [Deltaproteobacteria bacterium]|nr:B12-binding domain-containing radical SAM protein [Deltaproteobacteria bacterium]
MHFLRNPKETDLCLVFPPVWVPMVPHLALPTLAGFLRRRGVSMVSMDENVSFFVRYLFSPSTLTGFLDAARRLSDTPDGSQGPGWKAPTGRETAQWERAIERIERTLAVFREMDSFLRPDLVVQALDDLERLFQLCSRVHGPGDFSFNHYRRRDVHTVEDLAALCVDLARNVFLPYFRDYLIPRIERLSPMAVGISVSSYHQFVAAMTLGGLVREHLPDVHVVVGGKHLLNIRDGLLKDPLLYRRFIHSAVLREGERPLELLLEALRSGGPLEIVPGLSYLENGRVVETRPCEAPALSSLPHPDFTDTPWRRYLVPRRYAPIRMAEGCYWGKCTFCFRYRRDRAAFIPHETVLEEMERLIRVHGVHDLTVNDDCLPPEYWEAIADGVIERGLDLSMLIWAKPVPGFTRGRLKKMARAGVRQVRWGLESAQPRILKLMRKGTTVEGALRVLKDACAEGIWNHACMIAGFPTETREEAEGTVAFIRDHAGIIHSFIFYPFALYEDTHIFDHPEAFSIRDIQVEKGPLTERYTYTQESGMTSGEARSFVPRVRRTLLEHAYHRPFWHRLRIREYLQLYLDHYGLEPVRSIRLGRDAADGSGRRQPEDRLSSGRRVPGNRQPARPGPVGFPWPEIRTPHDPAEVTRRSD